MIEKLQKWWGRKRLDSKGWLLTALVAAVGIGLGVLVICWKWEMPSLGDWGDYLGGIFAAIAFIWLIVGHLHSQKRIEEGQKDVVNQMALTQEVVASLARLAASATLQDAARMAEMLPVFAVQRSHGTVLDRSTAMIRPVSWHVAFRNEGEGVTLTEVLPRTEGATVSVERLGGCARNTMFTLNFKAEKPISALGKLRCVLRFEDQLKRAGYAEIGVSPDNGAVEVEVRMGSPA